MISATSTLPVASLAKGRPESFDTTNQIAATASAASSAKKTSRSTGRRHRYFAFSSPGST